MATTMPARRATVRPWPRAAMAAAASANGSANIVCSNLIIRPNFTTAAEPRRRRGRPSGRVRTARHGAGPSSARRRLSGRAPAIRAAPRIVDARRGGRGAGRAQRAVGGGAARGRRRAWRPRASARPAPPGSARASAAISPHSDRSGVEARLSVPSASARPSASSAGTSGSRPPMCRFERGHSTTVAPASRARRRSSAPAQTMCTSSGGAGREGAQRREVRDRRLPGARVATSTPMAASIAGQRPLPSRSSASSSSSSATWIEVARSRRPPRRRCGAAARGRRSRARAARGRSRGRRPGRAAGALAGGVGERVAGARLARAEQLVEEDAAHARRGDGRRGDSVLPTSPTAAVPRRAAAAAALPRPPRGARRACLAGAFQDRPPRRRGRRRPDDLGQRRQLEVAVGVDEAGQQRRPRRAPRARRRSRRAARRAAPPPAPCRPRRARPRRRRPAARRSGRPRAR